MANADGSIIIEANVDDKKAQKELNALSDKISKLEEDLSKKKSDQSAIGKELEDAKNEALKTEQAIKQLNAELKESEKITSVSESSPGQVAPLTYQVAIERQAKIKKELAEQENILKQQDKETEKIANQYTKITDKVIQVTESLNTSKNRAGELSAQLATAGADTEKMAAATEKAHKSASKFSMRLREVIRSALVFTIITQALARFREWLGKVVKSNAEASAAIARLKGALLTLAQPIVNIIIPAFTTFVNILTSIINAISSLLSMLFGSTIDQSKEAAENLYNETDAIEGVGSAAKKASKSLASFDEINKLSGGSSESGDGGTGGISEKPIKPDFATTGIETGLERILNLAKLIGATILAWGLGKGFLDSLKKFFGFLIAIDGAVRFIKNFFDAWNNGLTWENIRQMLLGMAELAIGLAIALGPVAAGISLIITGLAMLALGFKDAFENGWNLQNLLLSVAGIFATGIGISLLTGSWIPALIAGIAALLLAITVAYGDGEALLDGFKTILEGFKNFILGVFTGDIERAIQGIGEIFGGLQTVMSVVLDAVKNMFNSFLDWLDEKTHGRLSGLIEWIRSFINSHIETVKTVLLSFVAAMEQIFTGILNFLSGVFTGNWDMAWQGIKEIFRGVINGIISLFEGMVNMVISGLNSLISAINAMIQKAADALAAVGIAVSAPQIPSIPTISIPRLAAGAVIPPNREFMAVLGDQKSGTNIETPLATMVQAFKMAMQETGMGGSSTIIMEVDSQQFAKVVYKANKSESRRIGVRLVEV